MKLLEPIALGPRTARNRVFFGATETNLGDGRTFSDRHVAFYARRAEGGVGVVVTEDASVHPIDWPYERAPLASLCGPSWRWVTDACQAHGALVIAGLSHAGGQGTSHWSQRELWAPSPVPEVNTREVPKVMEAEDIEATIRGFADAASVAVEAGCDGVEINAGQFSLIRQFLSGLSNMRDDEYAERELFARRVIAAVRAAVGSGAVVGLRLSCDELAPWAGITPESAADLVSDLVDGVDYVTVVRGGIFSAGATRPDGHEAPGFNIELARRIRAAVGGRSAVVAQGSIVDTEQAEWCVADQAADAVEMTRAQLADAHLVAKLAAGVPESIRPCVLCNQNCRVRDNRNPIVSCIADPSTGHETSEVYEPSAHAADARVVVLGGGPAGLEAARWAAQTGASVTLLESGPRLGGGLNAAAAGPGRERFGELVAYWQRALADSGVEVVTDASDDRLGEVLGEADALVFATGGRGPVALEELATGDGADPAIEVLPAAAALDEPDRLAGRRVVIWDPIGGPIGVSVAELALRHAGEVHLVTPDQIVGNELARSGDLGPVNSRLQSGGAVLHRRSVVSALDTNGLWVTHRFSGERSLIEADLAIDAGHRRPAPEGVEQRPAGLAESATFAVIGDAVAPRTVYEAVLEARRAVNGALGS